MTTIISRAMTSLLGSPAAARDPAPCTGPVPAPQTTPTDLQTTAKEPW